MAQGFFITGTGTGVGKTRVSLALIRELRRRGFRVAAMKPVATGAVRRDGGLRQEDAELLLAAANVELSYDEVNAFAYEAPTSPHIAARRENRPVDIEVIIARNEALGARADWVIVEGVGGWEVPLNADTRVSDLAEALRWPVVLVVDLRLGCLNQALLSAAAIGRSCVRPAGWIGNVIDPGFAYLDEYLDTLEESLPEPRLALLPWCPDGHPESSGLVLSAAFEQWVG
ncbi:MULTISPECIES: dethiobiotin synthase [Methylococcus]|uniref:ATP-dependent dethiobiotin synthetase BioD n=1 Tax=Methylococcus capsulatus TaxID=414 RepID=A0ABZ2F1H6_METCP|nr:dethiobiotin synthase [Methylococcus capsulatus]MDF9392806.1 dethiobiotin synthase [Methylococcus capsulatus]